MLALLAAWSLVASSSRAVAWAGEGHRIVCEIAWQRMAPETRRFVLRLLRGEARPVFSATCTWADDVRETTHPHTIAYHFANVPAGSPGFDLGRDCGNPSRRCVVWAIDHYARILADAAQPPPARRDALKFVAHFVGDLHQPLHVGRPGDRGGNDVAVTFFGGAGSPGRPFNLHRVWDVELLARAKYRWRESGGRLNARITPAQAAAWETLDVVAWANETYHVTDTFVYAALPRDGHIGEPYYRAALGHADVQLQKAGVRLAYLLNRAAISTLEMPPLAR